VLIFGVVTMARGLDLLPHGHHTHSDHVHPAP
jgi:hypothetical protein